MTGVEVRGAPSLPLGKGPGSQGMLAASRSWQRQGLASPLEPSEGASPAKTSP